MQISQVNTPSLFLDKISTRGRKYLKEIVYTI